MIEVLVLVVVDVELVTEVAVLVGTECGVDVDTVTVVVWCLEPLEDFDPLEP